MLKNLYLITFSLLAFVACSGDNYATGTVDPNANPQIAENDGSSSSSSIPSSGASRSDDKIYIEMPANDGVFVVKQGRPVSLEKEELYTVTFQKEATTKYTIVRVSVSADEKAEGSIAVYSEEKGASASCVIDEKNYSSQFKIGQNNRVERSIKLEKFGSGCDELFEQFKKLCLLQNVNDELSGACDDNGTLEAYCAYVDETAVFDTLLDDFTTESKTNCGDNSVHIDSFGI
jgi:hypothetical protein